MQKTRKVFQNGGKMGAKIEKKPVENEVRKTMRKRAHMPGGSVAGAFLRLIISSRLVFRPVFRLVLVPFHVSGRLVTSRN